MLHVIDEHKHVRLNELTDMVSMLAIDGVYESK